MIPQANPGAGYRAMKQQIDDAVARALSSGWYILGNELRAFEAEFAAWLGVSSVVGCGNGTDAIALALRGLGIGAGALSSPSPIPQWQRSPPSRWPAQRRY